MTRKSVLERPHRQRMIGMCNNIHQYVTKWRVCESEKKDKNVHEKESIFVDLR